MKLALRATWPRECLLHLKPLARASPCPSPPVAPPPLVEQASSEAPAGRPCSGASVTPVPGSQLVWGHPMGRPCGCGELALGSLTAPEKETQPVALTAGNVTDKEVWCAASSGSYRVGHDLVTEQVSF